MAQKELHRRDGDFTDPAAHRTPPPLGQPAPQSHPVQGIQTRMRERWRDGRGKSDKLTAHSHTLTACEVDDTGR